MRIRCFGLMIKEENLKRHFLKDSTVVVDAQNFFYQLYRNSDLEFVFGCESDKYAEYLRNYLNMFKKANVKCYFIFKGGCKDLMKNFNTVKTNELHGKDFDLNQYKYDDVKQMIVNPIFIKDVYMQVLEEMGFDYTYCEFESKKECIGLAQKLKCPVLSYDIEFCFSGLPYIMHSTLSYDKFNNRIECGLFSLDDFLQNHRLNEEKLALFAALTDENGFPQDHFIDFIKSLNIHLMSYYQRNKRILQWLARNTRQEALYKLFRYTNQEDQSKFLTIERNVKDLIRRREQPGIPSMYLLNGNQIEFNEKDEFWFQKGVASKHIEKNLINLARSNILEGTWAICDYSDNDARLISIDIMKYIYNLLTNFEKDNLIFFLNNQIKKFSVVPLKNSIPKPEYDGSSSPFENGWKHLKGELFEHFLSKTVKVFNVQIVNKLPEDLRMLMTAIIYFTDKKEVSTKNEVCSIILSYLALGVVTEADSNNNSKKKSLSSNEEIEDITNIDKIIAKGIFTKYSEVGSEEANYMFDVKLLHPLVEFQHCLQSLNHLNILCGKLYKPTIYSRTYNATFVYKVLFAIKTDYAGNCIKFLKKELNSAPSVLSYALRIMEIIFP